MNSDSNNAFNILQRELERRIKTTIVTMITENITKEVKGYVEKEVDKLTFEKIEQFRNHMRLKDEYEIHLKWRD